MAKKIKKQETTPTPTPAPETQEDVMSRDEMLKQIKEAKEELSTVISQAKTFRKAIKKLENQLYK